MLQTASASRKTPRRRAARSPINVIYGNVAEQDVDILALKFANGLFGTDLEIAEMLGVADFTANKGEYQFIDTRGAIRADQVLIQGVGPLHRFEYDEIKAFAHNAVALSLMQNPHAKTLGIAFHGVSAGLDELAAVSSLIQGLEDGFRTARSNELTINIIESNASRAKRAQQFLESMNSFLQGIPAETVPRPTNTKPPHSNFTRERADQIDHDNRLFCAMPFQATYLDHWDLAVQPAAHANDLIVERMDHASYTGDIMEEIKRRISRSKGVIAVLDGLNPNVFLEVGYAWAKDIPTILILHQDSQVPFDVSGHKILRYNRLGELKNMLTREIQDLY